MAAKVSKSAAKPAKKTLDAFRNVHDRNVTIPAKIKAGLADLEGKEGAEAWEYEHEFTKRAGIGQADIGKFREQFDEHVVRTNGKNPKNVWFVSPKTAEAARVAIS